MKESARLAEEERVHERLIEEVKKLSTEEDAEALDLFVGPPHHRQFNALEQKKKMVEILAAHNEKESSASSADGKPQGEKPRKKK